MLIKLIHDLLDVAIDKSHSEVQRRQDMTNAIHRSSVMLFLEKEKMFGKDLLTTQYLMPFEVVSNAWDVSAQLPSNYFRYTYLAKTDDTLIDVLADMEWATKIKNSIEGPTTDYPIAKIEGRKVVVLPDTITSVKLKYLKIPSAPVYATKVENNLEVFDQASSTDLEWSEAVLSDLLGKTLSFLGIGLRAEDVVQYAELQDNKSQA